MMSSVQVFVFGFDFLQSLSSNRCISMVAIASLRAPVANRSRFALCNKLSGFRSLAPRYRPIAPHVICNGAVGGAISAASAGDASKVSSMLERTDRY